MLNQEGNGETPAEQVDIVLKLDKAMVENFQRKAQRAGVPIEIYLSRTLSIVLGCRAFNETLACSPQITGAVPIQPVDCSS